MAAKSGIVRALQSFVGRVGKDVQYVTEGDVYAADDPLVVQHPGLFGPIIVLSSSPRVEQATAAPGEKRGA